MGILIFVLVVLVVLVLLELKTSRSDATLIAPLHPYRKLMLYIMPAKYESLVLFDEVVRAEALLEYLERAKERFHADVTHCVVGAVAYGMHQNPSMNRFEKGRRLYQRKKVWLTFSMKRKKLNRKAKLSAVKKEMPPGESFKSMCDRINETIQVERSDAVTYQDKELGLLSRIPRPILEVGVKLLKALDYYNLLPAGFIENDAMFTSMFIANLGSVHMAAGYHHLYEWGTCPLFVMVGALEERPMVEDGQVVIRKVLPLRFTYDERIEDGHNAGYGIKSVVTALENPFEYLGCLAEDGSDDHPLGPQTPPVAAAPE
ncbi:MAG: 2-oxo acid dehydrogenase subunit E2 [Deltaproteobacteria bacterium]|nr:2-oxo acid dehydrogenase subunit E2 [Deltaproteobacteria bacterium]